MSTSQNKRNLKSGFVFVGVSAFCLIFGLIYEHFAHGVISYFMLGAFSIPLVLGAVPMLFFALRKKHVTETFSLYAYNSGVATLTVGSLMKGALDIYGTTSKWMWIYPVAGGLLIFAGTFYFFVNWYCNLRIVANK